MANEPQKRSSNTPPDLEARLIDFGAAVCATVRNMRRDVVGFQIVKQIVRSATSPAANYAEARAAESRRDFTHKMQICLKELRESYVWLRLAERMSGQSGTVSHLIEECDQLTAIFVTRVKTA